MNYTITKNLQISNGNDGTWLHFKTDNGKELIINIKNKIGEIAEQWAKEYYESVIHPDYYTFMDNFLTDCILCSARNIIADTASDDDYNDFVADVRYYVHRLTSQAPRGRLPDDVQRREKHRHE